MYKKTLIVALALVATVGLGTLGLHKASSVNANDISSYHPWVSQLAERFNLDENEVSTFFSEQKQEKLEQMQGTKEEKLNQAVADGIITEGQKMALLERWQEMYAQKIQRVTQQKQEMQNWFEEQGIDYETLHDYLGYRQHGKFGVRMWAK
jgi:hypothetical protein